MKPVTRAAVLLLSVAGTLGATVPASNAVSADTSYVSLQHPQPVRETAKREVVEVFWYGCVHSQLLEQPLEQWAARQPSDVVLRGCPPSGPASPTRRWSAGMPASTTRWTGSARWTGCSSPSSTRCATRTAT